jgi:hypothetical protein
MRAIVLFWFCLVLTAVAADALDPADEYLPIYQTIERADQMLRRADLAGARSEYESAKASLERFASRHPEWNQRVIEFRRSYVTQQLAALQSPQKEAARETPADDSATQLSLMREQLKRLSSENENLYSRLQAALNARPSSVDPQELSKADEKIRSLQKENELLKVALQKTERPGTNAPTAGSHSVEELRKQLASARDQIRRQSVQIEELERNRDSAVSSPKGGGSVAANSQADQALKKELTDQRARNEILLAEKKILESHVAELASRQGAEIRARTEHLEQELAQARSDSQRKDGELVRLESDVRAVRDRLRELDRVNQELQLQLRGLRSSVEASSAETSSPELQERVKTLETEREALRRRVAALQSELDSRSTRGTSEPVDTPFSVSSIAHGLQPPRSDDALTASLAAEAQSAAQSGRWADAEAAYRQALRRSGRDMSLLSGLGAALLAQDRIAEADSTLQAVVTARPQDPAAVLLLGVVRARQRRDDDALILLSRAAQLDAANPEVYCLLGEVMERKGLAEPAEKTLRRAVELRPGYGEAHRALARLYASRRPPALELARHHQTLARNAGARPDPQVDRLLQGLRDAPTAGIR